MVIYSGYFLESSGADTYEFEVCKNGVAVSPFTEMDCRVTGLNLQANFVIFAAVELSTGDNITLKVKDKTGTGTLTFVNYHINVHPNH